jgi:hypothetical protein
MTTVTRIQRGDHPVDLDRLEQELHTSLEKIPVPYYNADAPKDFVKSATPPDIGRLSADAVLEQYNMAAKSVEEMGDEIKKRIAALEAALKECDADMKLLAEAAAAIRDKGKHAHSEIERTAAVSKDIRDIVDQIKAKLT